MSRNVTKLKIKTQLDRSVWQKKERVSYFGQTQITTVCLMMLFIYLCIQRIHKHPTTQDKHSLTKYSVFSHEGLVETINEMGYNKQASTLKNMTNSKKDLVGNTQLGITDHVSPSSGIGDSEFIFLTTCIFFKVSF